MDADLGKLRLEGVRGNPSRGQRVATRALTEDPVETEFLTDDPVAQAVTYQ